jgi:hypothetical protein
MIMPNLSNNPSIHAECLAINGMPDVSSFSPLDFRLAIAEQVKADNITMAEALADAGFSLFPESEDLLVICSLLAELRHDWDTAAYLLAKLVAMQDPFSPPATWQHYIRALRCNCEPIKASEMCQKALQIYPGHEILMEEAKSLSDWLGKGNLIEGPDTKQ